MSIESSVADLTFATNNLVNAVNTSKATLDAKVALATLATQTVADAQAVVTAGSTILSSVATAQTAAAQATLAASTTNNRSFTLTSGTTISGSIDRRGCYTQKRTTTGDLSVVGAGSLTGVRQDLDQLYSARKTFNLTASATTATRVDRRGLYTERRSASDIVLPFGSLADAVKSVQSRTFTITASDGPVAGRVDKRGVYTYAPRSTDQIFPRNFGIKNFVATLHRNTSLKSLTDTIRAVFIGKWNQGGFGGYSDIENNYRIPLAVEIPDPLSNRAKRIFQFACGRPDGGDDGANFISVKIGEIDHALDIITWSAERIIVITDATRLMTNNLTAGFNPDTGRMELLYAAPPVGTTQTNVPAPNNAEGINGNYVKYFSLYCPNPMAAIGDLQFFTQDGTARTTPIPASQGTEETLARDGFTPFMVVSPTCQMVWTWDRKLVAAAGGIGIPGGKGLGGAGAQSFGFLITHNPTAPVGQQWVAGPRTPPKSVPNETTIVELSDGCIFMDARPSSGGFRIVSISNKERTLWKTSYYDTQRPDSQCAGAICRLSGGYGKDEVSVIVTSNSAGPSLTRSRHTAYIYLDEGVKPSWKLQTYPDSYVATRDSRGGLLATPVTIATTNTAYSTMCRISPDKFYVAIETGLIGTNGTVFGAYSGITYQIISLAQIIRGAQL